jgi:hypothetical protein
VRRCLFDLGLFWLENRSVRHKLAAVCSCNISFRLQCFVLVVLGFAQAAESINGVQLAELAHHRRGPIADVFFVAGEGKLLANIIFVGAAMVDACHFEGVGCRVSRLVQGADATFL